MADVKIVLCPIDFSDLSRQELALAVELCETFGARLVLHHNLAAVSPGLTRAWEWNEVHRAEDASSAKAEQRLRAVLAELPKTVTAEATISSGPVAGIVLELAKQLPADVMVLGSHGWSSGDHASVTERIIDGSPCQVLTVHDGVTATNFRLRPVNGHPPARVVVPTDLSDEARRVTDFAFTLARRVPLELHLLHVAPRGRGQMDLESAERRLNDIVPNDVAAQTECHVRQGDAIEEILAFTQGTNPGFMLMGEHARSFLRRFFTRDTARELLHRAPCPVWFVPPRA